MSNRAGIEASGEASHYVDDSPRRLILLASYFLLRSSLMAAFILSASGALGDSFR